MTRLTDLNNLAERDGIDVAIAAFLATRLCGGSVESATQHASAMLTMFNIPHAAALKSRPQQGEGR